MKIFRLIWLLTTLMTLLPSVSYAAQPFKRGPGFIKNQGQIVNQTGNPNKEINYIFHSAGLNVLLKKNGFSYDTYSKAPIKDEHPNIIFHRVDIIFIGANPLPTIQEELPEPYTLAHVDLTSNTQLISKVFNKITYKDLYPNIDLEFVIDSLTPKAKFNFILHPGAQPSVIRWKYEGANEVSLLNHEIIISTQHGNLKEHIPYSYIEETNQPLRIEYKPHSNGSFGFTNLPDSVTQTIVIDPSPRIHWSGYVGGINFDYIMYSKTDWSGNTTVSGYTNSPNLATAGTYKTTLPFQNSTDDFVARYNSSGQLIWFTYTHKVFLNYNLTQKTLILQPNGNAVLVCHYSTSTQTLVQLISFNNIGNLNWQKQLFFNSSSQLFSFQDASGNIYLTGYTNAKVGISTKGTYIDSCNNCSVPGGVAEGMGYLMKLSSAGTTIWGTYFYGTGQAGIVDQSGFVYVTGFTADTQMVATPGAHQTTPTSGIDAFIYKFSPSGQKVWGTYLGGNAEDYGECMAIDQSGNIYVGGQTNSSNLISTPGSYQPQRFANSLIKDGFLAKFSPGGNRIWSTYFGGPASESIGGIAINPEQDVYLYVNTTSSSMATSDAIKSVPEGEDIVLAKFLSNGNLKWSTYWGGSLNDMATGIGADSTGAIYLAGITKSPNGIAFGNLPNDTLLGTQDGFITRILKDCPSKPVLSSNISQTALCPGTSFKMLTQGGWEQYTLLRNNKAVMVSNTPEFTTDTPGIFRIVTRHLTDNCIDTTGILVKSNFSKPISTFSVNDSAQCLGQNQFVFQNQSTIANGTYTIQWQFDDGFTSNQSTVTRLFNTSGTREVKLFVISNNQCIDSSKKVVHIFPQTQIGFHVNASNQCLRNVFQFIDTSSVSKGYYSRFWDLGDQQTDTNPNVNHSYIASGNYLVKLITTTDNGCIDSVTKLVSVENYPTPVPGFSQNNLSQCLSGNSFSFTDTSSISSGSTSPYWVFNDLVSDTGQTIQRQFSKPGTYTITLIQTSDKGCIDSIKKTIQVFPQTAIGFKLSQTNVCEGKFFSVKDTSALLTGTYNRLFSFDNQSASNNDSVVVNFQQYGTKVIKLNTITDKGCKDSTIQSIQVRANPQSGFTQNSIRQCFNNNTFTFADSTKMASGNIIRQWYINDSAVSSNYLLSHQFTKPGLYQVKLLVVSDFSCMDSTERMIEVYENPKPIIKHEVVSNCLKNNLVQLRDSTYLSNGSYSRQWVLGDQTSSSLQHLQKTYSQTGTYEVKLKVQSDKNCSDSTSIQINIEPNPLAKIALTSGQLNQCLKNNQYIFRDTSAFVNGIWLLGDGDIQTGDNVIKSYHQPGTYEVKRIAISAKGCSDTALQSIAVYPTPDATFTINKKEQCLVGQEFIITASQIPNPSTRELSWYVQDSIIETNTLNAIFQLPKIGIYSVSLKAIDNNQCTDSTAQRIEVLALPQKPILTRPTPGMIEVLNKETQTAYSWYIDGASTNTIDQPIQSITQTGWYLVKATNTSNCFIYSDSLFVKYEPIESISIRVFPNPSRGLFYVDFGGITGSKEVSVFDMHGRLVSKIHSEEKVVEVLTNPQLKGLFIVRAASGLYHFNQTIVIH